MTADPIPSPDFRAQLEWDITRSFRREWGLGANLGERRYRRLRTIALVTICLHMQISVVGVPHAGWYT